MTWKLGNMWSNTMTDFHLILVRLLICKVICFENVTLYSPFNIIQHKNTPNNKHQSQGLHTFLFADSFTDSLHDCETWFDYFLPFKVIHWLNDLYFSLLCIRSTLVSFNFSSYHIPYDGYCVILPDQADWSLNKSPISSGPTQKRLHHLWRVRGVRMEFFSNYPLTCDNGSHR